MTSARDLAADFWRRVGTPPPYPRDLEASVLWGLPLVIVKLPRLRVASVDDWFAARGRMHQIAGPDRELRACLFAVRGRGVVFVDAGDSSAEQRYSLAHEAAHFMADYLVPRERILARMGPAYEAILDGQRRAHPWERIDGLLAGVALGVHRHLMDRDAAPAGRVERAESRADRLALELLAPRGAVLRGLRRNGGEAGESAVLALLTERFGLPISIARTYASALRGPRGPHPSVRSWLGEPVELSAVARNRSQSTR